MLAASRDLKGACFAFLPLPAHYACASCLNCAANMAPKAEFKAKPSSKSEVNKVWVICACSLQPSC